MTADQTTDARARDILKLVTRLEEALDAEASALAQRDAEALIGAVDRKRRLVIEIARAWADSGLEAERSGATQHRHRHPGLTQLEDRLSRCRRLNEASGGAIAALLKSTSTTLGLLGVVPDAAEYGATGRGTDSPVSRPVAVG